MIRTIKGDYEIKRGEIYYISSGNNEEIGSEQRSGRPGIIVSNDLNNVHSETVEVVLLTTKDKTPLPTHVNINSSQYPSIALCEQVKTFDKRRVGDFIGVVSAKEEEEINKALAISLGLPESEDDGGENEAAMLAEINQLKEELKRCKTKAMTDNSDSKALIQLQKYKTERDIYKKMYEQVLYMVIGTAKDISEAEE